MGVCVYVPSADYSIKNLGRVNLTNESAIESIEIIGEDSIVAPYIYKARLYPIFTTERNIEWSIVTGGAYATISASGIVAPKDGVVMQQVTIRCSSTDNPQIYGEKNILVSDEAEMPIIGETISFDGNCAIDTGIPASMPTEIQVTLKKLAPESWANSAQDTKVSTIIGGRESSSSKRRDIQLMAVRSTSVINTIIFGVGGSSKDIGYLSLSPSSELYIAQGPTYYRYNTTTVARASAATFDSTVHYVVGAQNNNGAIDYTYASHDTFKNIKIYETEGGALLRDLVPATQNGIPGMWDNVTQTLFTNIGTGTLIVQ